MSDSESVQLLKHPALVIKPKPRLFTAIKNFRLRSNQRNTARSSSEICLLFLNGADKREQTLKEAVLMAH